MAQLTFDNSEDKLVLYSDKYAALFTTVTITGARGRSRLRDAKVEIRSRQKWGSEVSRDLADPEADPIIEVLFKRGHHYRSEWTDEYVPIKSALVELARVRLREAIERDPLVIRRARLDDLRASLRLTDQRIREAQTTLDVRMGERNRIEEEIARLEASLGDSTDDQA